MYYRYNNTSNFLLVGFDESLQDKIKQYISCSAEHKTAEIMAINDEHSDIIEHLGKHVFYNVIFISSDLSSAPLDSICRQIAVNLNGGVILVADDECNVDYACADHGMSTVIRKDNLNLNTVKDSIQSAKSNFDLRLKLGLAERRFSDILSNTSDWLWEIDMDLNYVYFHVGSENKGMYNTFQGEKFYKTFVPDEQVRIKKFFKTLIRKPESFQNEEFWGRDLTGKVCWSVSGVPVSDLKGKFIGFRGVSKNVSAEKKSQKQVYWLGNHDPVTGLFNQTRFYRELSNILSGLKKHERNGVLAIIDIDQFKLINNHYDNEAGDDYLCHIGNLLKQHTNSKDIVSRITSDQFALMMPEVTVAQAEEKLTTLVKTIADSSIQYRNEMISATVSIGIVGVPEHGVESSELIRKAEVATTRAKEKGRNRVHVFNPEEHNDSMIAKNLEMIDFISECLQEDRVAIYFQPIVSLKDTKNIMRYEVLMRMYDKDGNIMPPAELIQAAEEFGMHTKIDTVIATKAITQAKKWYHEEGRRVVLAINLSGLSFDNEDLIRKLGEMVEEADLPDKTITFEITETAALRDLSKAQKAIADLKSKGCCFSLDDFGTGYASFEYVKNLDFDYIKIDGSFIRNITNSPEDHVFVKALFNVASEMKIKTIAEMVEDLPTVELLSKIGIDYAQGYYFGKPKPYILD
ncbi:MAG: EAL domain-containing protein [Proteobacteria bacterium]|nr:EAL domain-containing protein [Pseudomonadota bacterium]